MVQEVYCRLLEKRRRCLRSFRGGDEKAWRTFLSRVVRSVVLDELRRRTAEKRSAGALESWSESSASGTRRWSGVLDHVPCLEPSPEQQLQIRQYRGRILRLPQNRAARPNARRNAEILWMALLEGWSSQEIASRMSVAPSTVDSVVYRARVRLAKEGLETPERCSGRRPASGSTIMAAP